MKIQLLLSLAGLAISFAAPALAQEQSTVDPEVRQQIEAVLIKLRRQITSPMRLVPQPYTRRDAIAVLSWGSAAEFASSPAKQSIKLVQCMQSATTYSRLI